VVIDGPLRDDQALCNLGVAQADGQQLEPGRPRAPDFVRLPGMTDQAPRVAALLQEAGETHHTVYRIVDGDDPDWASWYADWLLNLSELPQILNTTPVRSELVWLLVSLDKEYAESNPGRPWPEWYSERIIEHFGRRSD
jgi:hypothetical protein